MQRIERTLSQIVESGRPPVVSSHDDVTRAVDVMLERHSGCVLVLEGDRLAGIFTERDFLTRVVGERLRPESVRVADVMTRGPECLGLDDSLCYAINQMVVGGYRHVPVTDGEGRIMAILSVRDVVWHLAEVFADLERPPVDAPPGWLDLGGG